MRLTSMQKPLVVAGAVLFLFGLIQGGGLHFFLNPRMALSAHLTAVQSGTAMMVAGLVWPAMNLGPLGRGIGLVGIIGGMYGLWLGLTLSAATGASKGLPIAGAGHNAAPGVENVVTAIVLGSSGLMTVGWTLLVVGLVRSAAADGGSSGGSGI